MQRDTSLGGAQREFPSTMWSQFVSHRESGSPGQADMGLLATSYWKPVYSYIRVKWAKTNDEAKDWTQDFFLWMMETDFLAKVDRSRGRFRAFLKVALDHYLTDLDRMKRSLKRGGDRQIIELDRGDGDLPALEVPDPLGRTPDQLMDDAWRQGLLETAFERLERTLTDEGKLVYFQVFRDYCQPDDAEVSYKDLAVRYKISVEDVTTFLKTVKKRCRGILSDLVTETVGSREDLEAEMNWLFGEEAK